ncbi:MAG: bifunctional 4-hydroxy-2-oxoglutarate aldolase/2-dehydro-3-deoxy-phosphogluconate aldolase, partial [Nannocystaceae bacterium]
MTQAPLPDALAQVPVIPVLRLNDPDRGVRAAGALIAGGLSVLEVTLRTPRALEVITALRAAHPEAIVAAGTVLDPSHVRGAVEAGAQLLFSPCGTPELSEAAAGLGCPLVPGVSTPSEMTAAWARGHRLLKFFPAAASGGPRVLEALRGPLPELRFCPTGGILPSTMGAYLQLATVRCVGASWLVREEDL